MVDARIKELVKELNSEPIKVEIKELTNKMENSDFLHQKQFELMINMASKKLEIKIENLVVEISSLKKEVEKLKADRALLTVPTQSNNNTIKVPDDIQVEGFMQVKAPTRPVMSPTSEHAKGESPHPRLGNYKTEDVSVEKFFNFGRK